MALKALLGIDTGTGRAMAGLFDVDGQPLASSNQNITIWREAGDIVEQSSTDIWAGVCVSVRRAVQDSRFDSVDIGLDATTLEVTMGAMSQMATFNWPKRGSTEQFHRRKASAYVAIQDVEGHIRRSPGLPT